MSDTIEHLSRKIARAGELKSVVSAMKALAASSIGQYENSVRALADYYGAVELGLGVALREQGSVVTPALPPVEVTGVVVFGSDQGLVGPFNDIVADYAVKALADLPGESRVWAVGERVHARLEDSGMPPLGLFPVPHSVETISQLVGQILTAIEPYREQGNLTGLRLFYNQPVPGGASTPYSQVLLPLAGDQQQQLIDRPWPARNLPEIIGDQTDTLRALIREYLFVSLFRACAESLATENASRLTAMQRADKNIAEMQEELNASYHRLRQTGIDAELFDVVSGFDAQTPSS